MDWEGPVPDEDESSAVAVPDTQSPLSANQLAELQSLYDPMQASDNLAIKMYSDVLQFVHNQIF